MLKKIRFKIDSLANLINYILSRRPDEFGLLPDSLGFISLKELLKAVHEETGFGYVRESHIREMLREQDRFQIELADGQIRSLEPKWTLDTTLPCPALPTLLYTPIRQRAHRHALEQGLKPAGRSHLLLTADKLFAERLGRYFDPRPVILEVRADQAQTQGTPFYAFGLLYLAEALPARFIAGPPLPKEIVEQQSRPIKPKQKPTAPQPDFDAGTFLLKPPEKPAGQKQHIKGKKSRGWKDQVRGMRRK